MHSTTATSAIGRGFDILVPRSSMLIVYTTNHGTTDNITGAELLQDLTDEIDAL